MRAPTLFLLQLVFPAALAAQGWIIPRPPIGPPVCLDSRCVAPRPVALERTSSNVRATLADHVLRYEVEETFRNNGGTLQEADYMYPLPAGAAFQELQLSINGQLVSGEIMDAGRARSTYEEIVRRQRDPALVEWMGYGLLRARIFPINPGEEKRVLLRFQVIAPREGDAIRVDYQRGSGRTFVATGAHDTRESSFSLRYPRSGRCNAYSPTQELQSRSNGSECTIEVGGEGAAVTILIPTPRNDRAAISMLANAPGSEDGFALITLTPPSGGAATVPRDITFVLDVSGSMSGRKMEQARAAGRQLLGTLTSNDRFRMIDFSSDVRTFRDDFVSATPANLEAARHYLEQLQANGGTNIDGALDRALSQPRYREGDGDEYASGRAHQNEDRLSLVLFVTDGEPTVGERDPGAIAAHAARLRGSQRVFTFGLGADVNAQLIEQLALEGHGTAQFVRPEEDVERAVGLVASRLTSPIASDLRVSVQCRGDGGCVQLAHALPDGPVDLFAGQDLVLLTRYSGSGAARLSFDGRSARGPVHWETNVDFPDHDRDNAFVPRLWATRRIGWLSAARRQNGASPEVDDELRTLGERYGIPTELTSYLVQEPQMAMNTPRRTDSFRLSDNGLARQAPNAPAAKFEAAREATAQRDTKSVGAMDKALSLNEVVVTGEGIASSSEKLGTSGEKDRVDAVKRGGDHLFAHRNDRWTDVGFKEGMSVVKIKAFSPAYFAVLDAIPDLRAAFAVGDKVLVAGKHVAIEVSVAGVDTLDGAELRSLKEQW
ncbi:MAG TPA: VIT domain-containing protein [Gemmatimonadaceae bacterium]|nr:VIT domain-containing protein [Gemmatimonadaceae bacterium]